MIDLQDKLQQHRIMLGDECFKQFQTFGEELLEWNKIHNLTGAKCMESVLENIFDSLYPLKFIDEFESCMDIGSGGDSLPCPLLLLNRNRNFFL